MTRPLLIIFLTIFVNLIGFGIIIPLLPFYAETFGASPLVIGLLFAVFSLCQLVAAPVLGDFLKISGQQLDSLIGLGPCLLVQRRECGRSRLLQLVQQLNRQSSEVVDEIQGVLDLVSNACG